MLFSLVEVMVVAVVVELKALMKKKTVSEIEKKNAERKY